MSLEISSPGPLLVGHPKNNLKNGNQLRYTCSFRKSKPKPVLSWFLDNQEVRKRQVLKTCQVIHECFYLALISYTVPALKERFIYSNCIQFDV